MNGIDLEDDNIIVIIYYIVMYEFKGTSKCWQWSTIIRIKSIRLLYLHRLQRVMACGDLYSQHTGAKNPFVLAVENMC